MAFLARLERCIQSESGRAPLQTLVAGQVQSERTRQAVRGVRSPTGGAGRVARIAAPVGHVLGLVTVGRTPPVHQEVARVARSAFFCRSALPAGVRAVLAAAAVGAESRGGANVDAGVDVQQRVLVAVAGQTALRRAPLTCFTGGVTISTNGVLVGERSRRTVRVAHRKALAGGDAKAPLCRALLAGVVRIARGAAVRTRKAFSMRVRTFIVVVVVIVRWRSEAGRTLLHAFPFVVKRSLSAEGALRG